jgi:predicted TIM-barrel fold metal-dependent hydrolase
MNLSNPDGGVRPGDAPAAAAPPLRIDTDIHNAFGNLLPYLPRVWRDRWAAVGMGAGWNYSNPRGVSRRDVTPPNGAAPASDPLFLLSDHLDRYDLDYAILTGPGLLPMANDVDYLNAIASAYNDATIDTWLPVSDRFRGSILINGEDPAGAVREIRRCAGQGQFAQIIVAAATRKPLGQREFHPIYEVASELGMPVAIHPGTEGAGTAWPPTPVGWPSRYMEWHNILPIGFMAQINSLVTEGVFEKFPTLRFVAIEGGVAWLPHLMWRMDKNYKALRDTAPWLKRLPSEYVLDHVVLTTQPIEESTHPQHILQILEMIEAHRTLMFSSDYPHWDFDNPEAILPGISPQLRERIMGGTAAEVYGLTTKPAREQLAPFADGDGAEFNGTEAAMVQAGPAE